MALLQRYTLHTKLASSHIDSKKKKKKLLRDPIMVFLLREMHAHLNALFIPLKCTYCAYHTIHSRKVSLAKSRKKGFPFLGKIFSELGKRVAVDRPTRRNKVTRNKFQLGHMAANAGIKLSKEEIPRKKIKQLCSLVAKDLLDPVAGGSSISSQVRQRLIELEREEETDKETKQR